MGPDWRSDSLRGSSNQAVELQCHPFDDRRIIFFPSMEFEDVLYKRRSIRKFLSVPVEREKIAKILAAGNEAPCAGNIANWRFILVEDKATKQKIAEAALEQYWIAQAPSVIVVCSEQETIKRMYGLRGERLYAIQNCATAVENMLLEAVNLGLGSCFVAAFEEEAVARALDIPEGVRPQAILPIGYPGEEVPRPMRFKIEDITYINSWGNKIEFKEAYIRDYHVAERVIEKSKKMLNKIFKG